MLSSPTCVENGSPGDKLAVNRETLQVIAEDFTAESLTRRNLNAFEHKAVEKLWDYSDYLNILYNQNLDSAFRDQAGENIKDLFSGRSAPENPLPAEIDPESYSTLRFAVDSVDIIIPLQKKTKETYKGSMQYFQKISGISGSDTLILDLSLHQMGMILRMRSKNFGEDSVLVWEVLLSDR